jgi:heme exporter protein A
MITASSFAGSGLACIRGGRLLFAGLGFDLGPGACLLLTGPNGIGKSSLLRLMAGLLPAAAGRVRVETSLAYLGHADTLKAQLTVHETLAFWARLAGRDSATVDEAMAAYALEPLATMPCRYLSAGQRRRVALARVIADGARLWLLDEPLTALDSASIQAFERTLATHRAAGGLAVIATHSAIAAPEAETLEIARFAGSDLADPFYRGLTVDREA